MSQFENLKKHTCCGEYEVVKRLYSAQWKGIFHTREGHIWTFTSLDNAFIEFMTVAEQSNFFSDNSDAATVMEIGILNLETNKVYQIVQKADCSGLILFDPETGTVLKEREFDWLVGTGSIPQYKQL